MTGVEPAVAIAIVGVSLAAVSTGVAIYSSVQQANAAEDAAKSEQQARDAEAASAREAAAFEERQFRRRASLLLGKQGAITAASGLELSGTPILAELDNVRQMELEALNIRRTGNVGASAREFEGRLARQRGAFVKSQLGGSILGSTLKGGSSILGQWASYTRASKPPLTASSYAYQEP